MTGLRRTGHVLVIALIPSLLTGCASSSSRVARLWHKAPAETTDQMWAQAQQYEQEGRLEAAQQLYAKLFRVHPENPQYAHRLGVVSTILGDHERATVAYQKARQLDPSDAALLADMGYAEFVQQNYVEAEKLLRTSLAQNPDNSQAQCQLALVVGLQGRDQECLSLFREIQDLSETDLLCHLAYLKTQRGDKVIAAKLYERALAIDPTLTKASTALAQLKSGQTDERKQYPQYAYGNTPKATEPQTIPDVDAVEIAQTQAVEEPALEEPAEVMLTAKSDEQQSEEILAIEETPIAAAPQESLTGWSEDEADLATPVAAVEPAAPKKAANWFDNDPAEEESAITESIVTDESPFAEIVEQPAATSEPAVLEEDIEKALELPAAEPEQWAAAPPVLSERFTPEWVRSRKEQIAERNGQTGFMGFCPVMLTDELKLVDAQPQFSAEHQSTRYEFSSEEAQQKFAANPERYLPAAGGLDVVAVSQGTAVAQGSLEHALWFRHKLYLFMSRENLQTFRMQARQFAVQQ